MSKSSNARGELAEEIDRTDVMLLDVRRAVHVPLDHVNDRLSEMSAGEVRVHCASGYRLRSLAPHGRSRSSLRNSHASMRSSTGWIRRHLAKLRLAKLVCTRRHGTQVFYVAEYDHLERLTTEALFHADHATGTADSAAPTGSTRAAG